MKLQAFSVYDLKVEAFGQPWFASAIGQATRNFQDAVNNPETTMHKHSGDFQLFHVGAFDTETALFENVTPARLIGSAAEFKDDINNQKSAPPNLKASKL